MAFRARIARLARWSNVLPNNVIVAIAITLSGSLLAIIGADASPALSALRVSGDYIARTFGVLLALSGTFAVTGLLRRDLRTERTGCVGVAGCLFSLGPFFVSRGQVVGGLIVAGVAAEATHRIVCINATIAGHAKVRSTSQGQDQ